MDGVQLNDFEYEDEYDDEYDLGDLVVICGGDVAQMNQEEMENWLERQLPNC
ncbi:hypothetical protein [Vitreoscilla stercoraria]|uniref:Uncharacterized protein n=1 Tax=Vitreoscilla stercoraria TaxID=61 RepID=A0ABY4E880_VITST|nr:hypothetical protein [Vitreoscilla stercoraria]UOO91551.1 hypothetical protein LVJ81_07785 [Vitreoscilla stercoraria]